MERMDAVNEVRLLVSITNPNVVRLFELCVPLCSSLKQAHAVARMLKTGLHANTPEGTGRGGVHAVCWGCAGGHNIWGHGMLDTA